MLRLLILALLPAVAFAQVKDRAMRDASGKPGAGYWQQRVDYTISADLDTSTQTVAGHETIHYHNHSPDTLRLLWLQLDQNLYRADSRGAERFPGVARARPAGFVGGYTIRNVTQVMASNGTHVVASVHGTMMRVDLVRPIPPGDSAVVQLDYRFTIPGNGSERTARQRLASGWLYAVAQWFPRLAVYDDLTGWNTDEYLGQGEFYLEFGDIDFAVTVPATFIVAGTGELENATEVLSSTQRSRLAIARQSDTAIAIVSHTDAASDRQSAGGSRVAATRTWRFHASNVRDAAWAASPAFEWEASGWHGILMQAFHPPEASADWRTAVAVVRRTIRQYSTQWFPYPYATATAVAAPLASGMEYPTLVFDPLDQSGTSLERVILHEIGHQWFPMIVGSNERRNAWMDEGFDSFINWIGIGRRPSGNGRGAIRWATAGRPGPIMQPADSISPDAYDPIEYSEPDIGLELLRFEILDDTAAFDRAFREYIKRWAFKHPSPDDFFRTMDDVLGRDYSEFWHSWFYTTDVLDQAVDSVVTLPATGGTITAYVYLSSRGRLLLPVKLRITFADGTWRDVKLSSDIWSTGPRYRFDVTGTQRVVGVEIDPLQNFPDVDRSNNVWKGR